MPTWGIVLICVAVVACVGLGVRMWTLAVRLDRLHRRILSVRAVFDKALIKRAATCLQVADFGILGEAATATLTDSAKAALAPVDVSVYSDRFQRGEHAAADAGTQAGAAALTASPGGLDGASRLAGPNGAGWTTVDRLLTESNLSRTIRETMSPTVREAFRVDQVGAPLLNEFDTACYRVQVARRLHNQDVGQVRKLHDRWLVRAFHLAGCAALPNFVDLDDETN